MAGSILHDPAMPTWSLGYSRHSKFLKLQASIVPSISTRSDPEKLRVAVVGGSMGGLTTAVLLRDLGHEVDVFERVEERINQTRIRLPVRLRNP